MAAPHAADLYHADSHVASCVHGDHTGAHEAFCTDVQHVPDECEMEFCAFEAADDQVLAVNAEGPSVRLDLAAALIAEQISTHALFASHTALQWGDEVAEVRTLPIQLLTSTFLL